MHFPECKKEISELEEQQNKSAPLVLKLDQLIHFQSFRLNVKLGTFSHTVKNKLLKECSLKKKHAKLFDIWITVKS